MKRTITLCGMVAVLVLSTMPDGYGSDNLSVGGYYKSYAMAIDPAEVGGYPFWYDETVKGIVTNRLRLNVVSSLTNFARLNIAYDISPRVQDPYSSYGFDLGATFVPSGYRAVDLDQRLYPDEDEPIGSLTINQNLDRLQLTLETKRADIYVGRQAIAWGSARVINPTDVLVPYAFNELDVEDRRGVDAVRIRIPMAFMAEIDGGYVFGKDFKYENSAMFLRTKFYWQKTDISALAIGFQENALLGLDLTRAVGGAGTWVEAAYVLVGALGGERANEQDYFRASLGADYSLTNGTYLFAEYHYNQAGVSGAARYRALTDNPAYTQGAVYLAGEHYLSAGFSRQPMPLLTITGQVLVNLNDPSAYFMPQLEYNIAENVYLAGGAYIGMGQKTDIVQVYDWEWEVISNSEFGAYPDMFFTSFRVYF